MDDIHLSFGHNLDPSLSQSITERQAELYTDIYLSKKEWHSCPPKRGRRLSLGELELVILFLTSSVSQE